MPETIITNVKLNKGNIRLQLLLLPLNPCRVKVHKIKIHWVLWEASRNIRVPPRNHTSDVFKIFKRVSESQISSGVRVLRNQKERDDLLPKEHGVKIHQEHLEIKIVIGMRRYNVGFKPMLSCVKFKINHNSNQLHYQPVSRQPTPAVWYRVR